VKTDKVDAATLAQLLAADFVPEVWMPDETTRRLRREVAGRAALVRQRTQVRNRIHAALHRCLQDAPVTDLFGVAGQAWLREVALPEEERAQVEAALRVHEAISAMAQVFIVASRTSWSSGRSVRAKARSAAVVVPMRRWTGCPLPSRIASARSTCVRRDRCCAWACLSSFLGTRRATRHLRIRARSAIGSVARAARYTNGLVVHMRSGLPVLSVPGSALSR
jgi:hypothetical protein